MYDIASANDKPDKGWSPWNYYSWSGSISDPTNFDRPLPLNRFTIRQRIYDLEALALSLNPPASL